MPSPRSVNPGTGAADVAAHETPPPSPPLAIDIGPSSPELARLAEQVRRLTAATVRTRVAPEVLQRVAEDVARSSDQLEQELREGSPRRDPDQVRSRGLPFQYNPVLGTGNPYAPPVEIEVVDGAVHGTARMHHAHEGPPGFVHGGILSLVLDQTLGLANVVAGRAGMTLALNVRYLHPTPLDTDLEIHSVHDRVEGKNIVSVGSIRADGRTTATAEGIFRAVPQAKGRQYFKDHFDRR